MDNKFQTSFIPQKPMVDVESRPSSTGINLFLLISIVIFVLSVAASAGVWFWHSSLKAKIDSSATILVNNQKSTDTQSIAALISLDNLLSVSNELLNKHIAISPIFQFLQAHTITNVRFKDFGFSNSAGGKIAVKMSGQAKDFNTIAAQSDAFNSTDTKAITNPIFSDFSPQADGTVSFNFTAEVVPDLINYALQKNGSEAPVRNTTQTTSEQNTNTVDNNNNANQPAGF